MAAERITRTRAAIGAVVAGLAVGGAYVALSPGSSGAAPSGPPSAPSSSSAPSATSKVTTNADGLTIGPIAVGQPPPDLTPIYLSEDTANIVLNDDARAAAKAAGQSDASTGYLYSKDFLGPQDPATSPAEAAAQTAKRVDANGDIWIPIYAIDGKTVLGKIRTAHVEFS